MSEESGLGKRLGKFAQDIRSNADSKDQNYKEAAFRVDADRTLAIRLESKWKLESQLIDETIDISDKVKLIDMEVEMIAQAWGRGATNPEWTIRYNAWRNLIAVWSKYERHRYARVEQLVEVEYSETHIEAGGKKVQVSINDTMRPSTAITRMLNSKAEESFKILGVKTNKVFDEDSKDHAFAQYQREEFVRQFGEDIMVRCGKVLMNWGWHEMDVTTKAVLVFHGAATDRYSGITDTSGLGGADGAPQPSRDKLPRVSKA